MNESLVDFRAAKVQLIGAILQAVSGHNVYDALYDTEKKKVDRRSDGPRARPSVQGPVRGHRRADRHHRG